MIDSNRAIKSRFSSKFNQLVSLGKTGRRQSVVSNQDCFGRESTPTLSRVMTPPLMIVELEHVGSEDSAGVLERTLGKRLGAQQTERVSRAVGNLEF